MSTDSSGACTVAPVLALIVATVLRTLRALTVAAARMATAARVAVAGWVVALICGVLLRRPLIPIGGRSSSLKSGAAGATARRRARALGMASADTKSAAVPKRAAPVPRAAAVGPKAPSAAKDSTNASAMAMIRTSF
eukprot:scaffold78503_cov63-Phaeocystis_antarctica.AAC.5